MYTFVFPAGSGQWAELFSPSLVWNSQKRDYAIAFTHQDYLSNKPVSKNSLRLAIYDGTGKKIHPGIGHNLLICPDHCDVASLTADSNTGAYAVAYYASSMGANIMFFDVNAGPINKTGNHLLQKGTQTKNLNVRYNIHDNNYFYTDNIYGSELGISIIQKNGKITKSYSKGKGYDLCFSVTPFGWAYNSHIISATDNHDDRVHCWNVMVGNSGAKDGHQKDLAWTPKGSKHPSVATVNKVLPYLAWIQNGTLRFSCLVKKQGLP